MGKKNIKRKKKISIKVVSTKVMQNKVNKWIRFVEDYDLDKPIIMKRDFYMSIGYTRDDVYKLKKRGKAFEMIIEEGYELIKWWLHRKAGHSPQVQAFIMFLLKTQFGYREKTYTDEQAIKADKILVVLDRNIKTEE